jgi:polyisoprenoid-binding protein YceI
MSAWPRLLALAACAAAGAAAQPVTYVFDVQHTFVQFEVVHFGTSTMRGRFGSVSGDATLDRAAGSGRIALRVPTAAVDTGLAPMDAKLRERDMLASEAYDAAGAVTEVRGELTLRGVSRPLLLRALRFGCHVHPLLEREVCGGDFEGEFKRSEFGVTYALPFVADRVRLLVSVEGIRR